MVSVAQLIAGDMIPSVTVGKIEDAVSLAQLIVGEMVPSATTDEMVKRSKGLEPPC